MPDTSMAAFSQWRLKQQQANPSSGGGDYGAFLQSLGSNPLQGGSGTPPPDTGLYGGAKTIDEAKKNAFMEGAPTQPEPLRSPTPQPAQPAQPAPPPALPGGGPQAAPPTSAAASMVSLQGGGVGDSGSLPAMLPIDAPNGLRPNLGQRSLPQYSSSLASLLRAY